MLLRRSIRSFSDVTNKGDSNYQTVHDVEPDRQFYIYEWDAEYAEAGLRSALPLEGIEAKAVVSGHEYFYGKLCPIPARIEISIPFEVEQKEVVSRFVIEEDFTFIPGLPEENKIRYVVRLRNPWYDLDGSVRVPCSEISVDIHRVTWSRLGKAYNLQEALDLILWAYSNDRARYGVSALIRDKSLEWKRSQDEKDASQEDDPS